MDSVVGSGSTFRICLPAGSATASMNAAEPELAPSRGGDETILLVEDEEMVRIMIRDTLQDAGYTVLEARQGDQALKLI
ncbi:hypothetical protein NL533_30445, partial [Klebsiella pneumoniae]|nr:hypothetical protein [Klebsiella pneumoniae]